MLPGGSGYQRKTVHPFSQAWRPVAPAFLLSSDAYSPALYQLFLNFCYVCTRLGLASPKVAYAKFIAHRTYRDDRSQR